MAEEAEPSSDEAVRDEADRRPADSSRSPDSFLVNTKIPLPMTLGRLYSRLGAAEALGIQSMSPDVLEKLGDAILGDRKSIASLRMSLPELESKFPPSFWQSLRTNSRLAESAASVASLYSRDQLARAAEKKTPPRPSRTAEDFFNQLIVEVDSIEKLLKTLYTIQSKHHEHRLVWRGQRNIEWGVHSSLYRQLDDTAPVDEARLIEAEAAELTQAAVWGIETPRPLEYFAQLQHHGAPTRLIDVSADPEMACWFAVEQHPDDDAADALVLAWGRSPRVGRKISAPEELTAEYADAPFWHDWVEDEERAKVGWGTGTRAWTWFPPALSDRMRAQRAGFILEAGPILTDDVVAVFNDLLPMSWTSEEIAQATSVVGLPSRHDVLTKENAAHLVPLFAIRIAASAKQPILDYLRGKGLHSASVYPDLGGLVSYLSGPRGPR